MITARIEPDNSGNGLWMMIDGSDDPENNCSWPITKEEVEPIMEACREYLKINQKE